LIEKNKSSYTDDPTVAIDQGDLTHGEKSRGLHILGKPQRNDGVLWRKQHIGTSSENHCKPGIQWDIMPDFKGYTIDYGIPP